MHEPYLLAALDAAWQGRGFCAPNPSVGAVAVQNKQIIAQAWHHGAGTAHAEQLLLEKLPQAIQDVTLYVTLEPCNHWGRTPPCVDVIIQRGIQRVVYAYADPNPTVRQNQTPMLLQQAGIEVIHHPIPAIDAFYESYQYWTQTKKPWVTVKLAQSLDGKIAGPKGQRCHLTNEACGLFTHKQRLCSDIILTTTRTIQLDNPSLNVRLPQGITAKSLAILDRTCQLSLETPALQLARHSYIFHDPQWMPSHSSPQVTYCAIPTIDARLDLVQLIMRLGNMGFHDVWVEAGATLFNELHHLNLVNRTYLYVAPTLVGDDGIAAYQRKDWLGAAAHIEWQTLDNNSVAKIDWKISV